MKHSKTIFKNSLFLIIILSLVIFIFGFRKSQNYGYDYYQQITAAPPAYRFGKQLSHSQLSLNIVDISDPGYNEDSETKVVDILVWQSYRVVATDKGIYIYSSDYTLLDKISKFTTTSGEEYKFKSISSVSAIGNNIYIADTPFGEAFCKIFVFSLRTAPWIISHKNTLSLDASSNVPGLEDKGFRPKKIAVSKTGAVYCLCENIIEGIIEIDNNSNFKRYLGTNKIELSTIEQFWRKLSPKSATGKKTYVPADFSSLVVDNKGFIYTTTAAKGNKPIQKLNFKGENVLVENGNTKVVGDIFNSDKQSSTFVDIDVNEYGIYLALDAGNSDSTINAKTGRKVFAYNNSGDLLYIIGNHGDSSWLALEQPYLVRWDNGNIIIVDKDSRIHFLEPTEYGELINKATKLYSSGEFDEALPYWKKLIELNSNNELAYIGIGKVNLRNQEYGKAMTNFELGNSRINYSKAYEKVRNERLARTLIPIFIAVIAVGIIYKGVLVWIEKKY